MDKISYHVECSLNPQGDSVITTLLPFEEFFQVICSDISPNNEYLEIGSGMTEVDYFNAVLSFTFKDAFKRDKKLCEAHTLKLPKFCLIQSIISDTGVASMCPVALFYSGIYLEYLKSI